MTHRHYTRTWQRCIICGRPSNGFSDFCDDDYPGDPDEALSEIEAGGLALGGLDYVPAASECTCRTPHVSSAALEPPEPILDRYCPVHGDGGPDPDAALEEQRDRAREDRNK